MSVVWALCPEVDNIILKQDTITIYSVLYLFILDMCKKKETKARYFSDTFAHIVAPTTVRHRNTMYNIYTLSLTDKIKYSKKKHDRNKEKTIW